MITVLIVVLFICCGTLAAVSLVQSYIISTHNETIKLLSNACDLYQAASEKWKDLYMQRTILHQLDEILKEDERG